jgi:hypothetical protein
MKKIEEQFEANRTDARGATKGDPVHQFIERQNTRWIVAGGLLKHSISGYFVSHKTSSLTTKHLNSRSFIYTTTQQEGDNGLLDNYLDRDNKGSIEAKTALFNR